MNLLIVDDEPLHRQGLMKLMQKLRPGYRYYEAINGENAVKIVNENEIDVILTDIRMPVMDGFEFLRRIDPESKNMKVIVVTAYRDFEYAKQALHFRAFDYILKPIDVDTLELTLAKVERHIRRESEQSIHTRLLNQKIEHTQRVYLEHQLLKDYTIGLNEEESEKLGDYFPFDAPGIAICTDISEWGPFGSKEDLYAELSRQWSQWGQLLLFSLKPASDEFSGLLRLRRDLPNARWSEPFAAELAAWNGGFYSTFSCRLTIGLSSPRNSLKKDWKSAYQQARISCDQSFFNGLGNVYTPVSAQPDLLHDIPIREYKQELKRSLRERDKQAIRDRMHHFHASIPHAGVSPSAVKSAYEQLLSSQLAWMEADPDMQSSIAKVTQSRTLDNMHERALDLLLEWIRRMEQTGQDRMEQIILDCREYVDQHYMEDMTLESLAERYHFNASYFSQQFKRFTGMNLSDYLMDVRLEQAKNLLIHTDGKVHRIASAVGYSSDKYFIRLFKRRTGMTPNEYRNLHDQQYLRSKRGREP